LKFPNGQFPLKIPDPINQATLEQNKKKQKTIFFFTRGGDYTWVGKGYFFTTEEKFKDFQFLILPAYLPLKFPNGQFPLKIPGPISQAKLKPKKKQIAPYKKKFKWRSCDFTKKIAFG
jgi:hypothetical protein